VPEFLARSATALAVSFSRSADLAARSIPEWTSPADWLKTPQIVGSFPNLESISKRDARRRAYDVSRIYEMSWVVTGREWILKGA